MCGVPLLLWFPAVALTAYPPFRDAHMPELPAQGQRAQRAQQAEQVVAVKPANAGSSSGLIGEVAAGAKKEE